MPPSYFISKFEFANDGMLWINQPPSSYMCGPKTKDGCVVGQVNTRCTAILSHISCSMNHLIAPWKGRKSLILQALPLLTTHLYILYMSSVGCCSTSLPYACPVGLSPHLGILDILGGWEKSSCGFRNVCLFVCTYICTVCMYVSI